MLRVDTIVVEPRISTKIARPPATTPIRNAVVRPAGFFEVARISRAITVTITSSIATTTCQVTWVILFWRETTAESYDQCRCSTSKFTGRFGDGTRYSPAPV